LEAIILTKDQYTDILEKIEEINTSISKNSKESNDSFIDNQEFIKLMSISKRTAQSWRDQGVIAFSQIGGKIYYRAKDLTQLLDCNYNPIFKKGKNKF
jgi:hypothetical protein